MKTPGTLYILCGKMASGKSTLAKVLAENHNAIVVGEDELLRQLYPDDITDVSSYVYFSSRLKTATHKMFADILLSGTSLVLDFPANTVSQRSWFNGLLEITGAQHELHYLQVSDSTCKARLAKRAQEQPERAATDTPEMFDAMTRYFEAPGDDEELNVRVHSGNSAVYP